MSRSQLRVETLQAIQDRLFPHGFVLRDERHFERFERETGTTRQTVSITFRAAKTGWLVEPVFGIRIHAVHEFLDQFDSDRLTVDRSAEQTISIPLAKRFGLWKRTWLLAIASDAQNAAEALARIVSEEGEQVFQQYNPRALLYALAADDHNARRLSPSDECRAKYAIALAFILNGRSAAQEVAEAKLSWLRKNQRHDRDAVEALVQRMFLSETIQ
jgi:hypothetical protein